MILRYEDQGMSRFAVYDVENEASLDKLTLGMLTNNKIKGFARTGFLQLDSSRCLRYEVTGLEPLTQVLEARLSDDELITLMESLCDAFVSADDYMIDSSFIYADKDCVFINKATLEASMLCIPDKDCAGGTGAASFFKSVVTDVRPGNGEAERLVAKLLSCVNSQSFSIGSLSSLLFEVSRKDAEVDTEDEGAAVDGGNYYAGASGYVGAASSAAGSGYNQWDTVSNDRDQFTEEDDEDNGESISFMYLMQHYNKENAALYKAQKDKKKGKSGEEKGKKAGKKQKDDVDLGFVVPGQSEVSVGKNDRGEKNGYGNNGPAGKVSGRATEEEDSRSRGHFGLGKKKKNDEPQRETGIEPGNIAPGRSQGSVQTDMHVRTSGPAASELKPRAIAVVHLRTGLKMRLTDVPVNIGRDPQYNQFVISDNILIGRRPHATVYIQNGQAFVKDDNSTNHTFINGAMLPPNEPQPIKVGQVFTLANDHFMLQYIED